MSRNYRYSTSSVEPPYALSVLISMIPLLLVLLLLVVARGDVVRTTAAAAAVNAPVTSVAADSPSQGRDLTEVR